jgi:ribonuclease HII
MGAQAMAGRRKCLNTGSMFSDLEEFTATGAGSARWICGVDEAGRGPWAGPVAAAAVILDPARPIVGLNDSKKLTSRQRERLMVDICRDHHVAVVFASTARIDRVNIRAATLWAMRAAVSALPLIPDLVLVDGLDVPPGLPCPGEAIVRGDGRIPAIAAASIVAKVSRDRLMTKLRESWPDYGFECHMGYGVASHADALGRLGLTPVHRRSFKPMSKLVPVPRN